MSRLRAPGSRIQDKKWATHQSFARCSPTNCEHAAKDTLALIANVVEAERQCCRFLRFGIQVEPDDGPVYLDLTGPPGTREFLAGVLGG